MELKVKEPAPIDPLHRVFIYNQRHYMTKDGTYYVRPTDADTIRRQIPKVRGKSARRADKLARRKRA